jgi:hypothetical protein
MGKGSSRSRNMRDTKYLKQSLVNIHWSLEDRIVMK